MLYKNENYCAQQLAWSIEEYTKQVDVFSTVKDLNPVLFQHKVMSEQRSFYRIAGQQIRLSR